MRRLSFLALLAFAATAAMDWPAPPGAERVRAADLFAAASALAFALSGAWRGPGWGGARAAALAPAAGLAAWTALSAAGHGAGAAVALGAAELATVLALAAAFGREPAGRDLLLRAWIAGAALACVVGLIAAALATGGIDPAPLHAGGGELGWAWRPAGLCRTGMLASWALVPFLLLWLDGARLAGRWRRPLLALLGLTLALTVTRTLLAIPVGLLAAAGPGRRALRTAAAAALLAAALASVRWDLHGSGAPGIRWRIAEQALQRAGESPLLGVGPDQPAAIVGWPGPLDPPLPWDAHSTLVDLAATRGLPAAALFAAALALAWPARRERDPRILGACLMAMAFDALTIDAADFRHLWLLCGLCAAVRIRE